jgi:hypothetical protein
LRPRIVTPLPDRLPREPFHNHVNFWLVLLLIGEIAAVVFLFLRPPPLDESFTPEEVNYFKESTFAAGRVAELDGEGRRYLGRGFSTVHKWTGPIAIAVVGGGNLGDLREVRNIAKELDQLLPIEVDIVDDPREANITVRFIPRARFIGLRPDDEERELGFMNPRFGGPLVLGATVYVDSDQSPSFRRVIVRHELMHALGFPVHTLWERNSTLFVGPEDGVNYPDEFVPIDKAIIRILYDARVKPGMTLQQIEELGI